MPDHKGILFESQRLEFRKFRVSQEDAAFLHQLLSDPKVFKYLDGNPSKSIAESKLRIRDRILQEYEQFGYGRLLVCLKKTGEIVGFSGLKHIIDLKLPELGFSFIPSVWGQGYATEAALASLQYGRNTLGLKHFIALIAPENAASIKVVRKCGFTRGEKIKYNHLTVYRYELSIN